MTAKNPAKTKKARESLGKAGAKSDALQREQLAVWFAAVQQIQGHKPSATTEKHYTVRPLESKLWEMRMKGRDGIARAVYAAVKDRRLLVLHVFVKKTQTTPRRAIDTALERLDA